MVKNDPVTRLTHPMIDPSVATRMQKGKIVTLKRLSIPSPKGG